MKYGVFSRQYVSEDGGFYIGWGIECRNEAEETEERIEDFSDNEAFVRTVADVLNREKVERVHLADVLENILLAPEELE